MEVPVPAECLVPKFPELVLTDSEDFTVEDLRLIGLWGGKVERWRDLVLACPGLKVVDDSRGEVAQSLLNYAASEEKEIRGSASVL